MDAMNRGSKLTVEFSACNEMVLQFRWKNMESFEKGSRGEEE